MSYTHTHTHIHSHTHAHSLTHTHTSHTHTHTQFCAKSSLSVTSVKMYHMIIASSLVFLALCAPSLAYVDGAREESCYNHSVIHLQPFTDLPAELITCNDPCIFQVDVRLVLDMSDITNVTVNDSLATTYECGSTYQGRVVLYST